MSGWLSEPVAAEACDRVRQGVLRKIRRRRVVRRASSAAAVFVFLLAVMFWPRVPDLEVMALTPPAPPPAPEVRLAAKTAAPDAAVQKSVVVRKKQAPVVLTAKAAPAERITIFTDDPDVVIVLVGGGD